MMKLTRTAIGLLTRQYRSVLRKCFLINAGLYALLAPAATITTAAAVALTAMPTTAEAAGSRHVIESGETVDKITETFSGNATSERGGYVYNDGTVGIIDALISGNTGAPRLIENYKDITSIKGYVINNTSSAIDDDDGVLLRNNSFVDIIDITAINNIMDSSGSDNHTVGGLIAQYGTVNTILGTYVGNAIKTVATTTSYVGTRGAAIGYFGGSPTKEIRGSFIGNYIKSTGSVNIGGGAISLADTAASVDKIEGDFIGNYVSNNASSAYGGAIDNVGTIGSIGSSSQKALFLNNSATSTSGTASGGAIYNAGTITGDVNADFIGNKVSGAEKRTGGSAIRNENGGKMANISGNFIGNKTTNTYVSRDSEWSTYGAAISNFSSQNDSITEIKDISGNFINNSNNVSASVGYGAAISNLSYILSEAHTGNKSKIKSISGNFIGNKVNNTDTSDTTGAYGAGVLNRGYSAVSGGEEASISSIKGYFINNAVTAALGNAAGGAIFNEKDGDYGTATITSITADFINNSATSTNNGAAQGGAIYNSGTISNLSGDFINNSLSTGVNSADGGAIYNTGIISKLTGVLKGNILSAYVVRGGAIYNTGTMNIVDSYIVNNHTNYLGNNNARNGTAILNTNTMTLTDTSVFNNTSTAQTDAQAIRNGEGSSATMNINAVNKDVSFFGNRQASGSYYDISNVYLSNLNLNAKADKKIVFNGGLGGGSHSVNTHGYININQGTANTGGEYVFNNSVGGSDINLYNNANVRFGNARQNDGTVTYGSFSTEATTVDSTGGYLNFANNNTAGVQHLGNLTLGNDLKIGIDTRLAAENSIDGLSSGTVTSNGHKILIDYINAWYPDDEETTGTSYVKANWVSPSTLVSIIDISPTLHINSAYEWDGYDASYNSSNGQLTITRNSTGTENLAGFLTQNATGTEYNMVRDEQMLVDLGAMAGENNSKTINANGYNIIGNQHSGVTLAEGQTLTINDANVEGFYKEDADGAVVNATSGVLNISNSVFRNNAVLGKTGSVYGGAIRADSGNIVDSSFYNNLAINDESASYWPNGGAILGSMNIYARTKNSIFEGNKSGNAGGAYNWQGIAEILGENGNKVIFSNNSSTHGGAIVGSGNGYLTIDNAEFLYNDAGYGGASFSNMDNLKISNSLLKGNSAVYYGGGIYSGTNNTISISNSTFTNNTAATSGGAIYNEGTIATMADVAHETYTIKKHVVTKKDTTTSLTYYDQADVTAINNIIAQNKKIQILTQEVTETKEADDFTALQAAIAADTTHTTYAEKNPKLLVAIDNYWMPTGGGIQNTTFEGNYITANSTTDVKGGAIYNAEGGMLNIEGSTFKNNLITQEGTGEAYGVAIYNEGVIGNLDAEFEGNKVVGVRGDIVHNKGVISNITANFVDNTSTTNTFNRAIFYNEGSIGSITGNFLNNSSYGSGDGRGAAIQNSGQIGSISGNFIGNIISSGNTNGAAIFQGGRVESIEGIFKNNVLLAYGEHGLGAAIINRGKGISTITGVFENNYVKGAGRYTGGGAIASRAVIDAINADFIGNHVIGSAVAHGGAIDNYTMSVTEIPEIGSINGNFKNNYVLGTDSANAMGGAIYNDSGQESVTPHITSIGTADNHAKFEGNYAQANTGDALGGAIYNAGTIDNIYADFKDNYAISAGGNAYGGAIFNSGKIGNIVGSFTDNRAKHGSVIYNNSTSAEISNITGVFKNNVSDMHGIIHSDGKIKITDSVIANNTSGYDGVLFSGGSMLIKNSVFKDNTSNIGGIYAGGDQGIISVSDSVFQNNKSNRLVGGALMACNQAILNAVNTYLDGNKAPNGGAMQANKRGIITLVDSLVVNNSATNRGGGAYLEIDTQEGGTLNLIANTSDVVFRNNTDSTGYNDVYMNNHSTLNLNAKSGHNIDFGGTVISGASTNTLNINKSGLSYTDLKDDGTFETETKNITQTGGDYIFRNTVSGQTMNLYNGANVQLRRLKQADGNTTIGGLTLTSFTTTGAGNILDTANNNQQYSTGDRSPISLGNVSLGAKTTLRLDVNTNVQRGDYFTASSFTGSNFSVDTIIINESNGDQAVGTQYTIPIADSVVKSHIELASSINIMSALYKGGFNVGYNSSTGNLVLTKTANQTYNLRGFLANDASGTLYELSSDEYILEKAGATSTAIGPMAGTNNTKRVNAGNYTINGDGHTGVTVNPGQTLNINGGVWEGFQQNAIDTSTAEGVKTVNINNSTFRYNTTIGGEGGPAIDNNIGSKTTIVDSQFIQNQILGGSSGGAIWNSAELTIKAENRNVEFQGNSAPSSGAIGNYGTGTTTINATGGDVIFSNNKAASTVGGAIYNTGTLSITSTDDHRVKFENNTAGTSGGAIHNTNSLTITATDATSGDNPTLGGDVIFSNNTAGTQGGAIYNTGILTINSTDSNRVKFEGNSITYSGSEFVMGGAIFVGHQDHTTIIADFINNYIENTVSGDSWGAGGGAIKLNVAKVDTISGKFTGNYVHQIGQSDNEIAGVYGGAIQLDNGSHVTNLSGEFKQNYVAKESGTGNATGGAITITGEAGSGIDHITNSSFIENHAQTKGTGQAQGGALRTGGQILNIGDSTSSVAFTSNYIESNGNSYGGGIWNMGQIGDIVADFTGNYAKSTGEYKEGAGGTLISGDTTDDQGSGRAYGGAIFNLARVTKDEDGNITGVVENTGVIDSITGDFKNNYVYSENGYALGGAIYNEYGTIGSIGSASNKAKFEGNKAESGNKISRGGAIANNRGTITGIFADFKNNYIKSSDDVSYGVDASFGAAIANIAIDSNVIAEITSITGNFEGNQIDVLNGKQKHDYTYGGAIANFANSGSTAKISSIVGDFIENSIISYSGRGGAIGNTSIITSITGNFEDNYISGGGWGGAIFNGGTIGSLDTNGNLVYDDKGIVDSNFTGNYINGEGAEAESGGGAIWNSGKINIVSTSDVSDDVVFSNNRVIANGVSSYNDIYSTGTIGLGAATDKAIIFGGSVIGGGTYNINTGTVAGGTYVFKSDLRADDVKVGGDGASLVFAKGNQEDGSTTYGNFEVDSLTMSGNNKELATKNDHIDENKAATFTLNGSLNMALDGDLSELKADSLNVTGGAAATTAAAGSMKLAAFNIVKDPDAVAQNSSVSVVMTDNNTLANAYTIDNEADFLDNITSTTDNYNQTYVYRSASYTPASATLTLGNALTLTWLDAKVGDWDGYYIKHSVRDGHDRSSEYLTVGDALESIDAVLGKRFSDENYKFKVGTDEYGNEKLNYLKDYDIDSYGLTGALGTLDYVLYNNYYRNNEILGGKDFVQMEAKMTGKKILSASQIYKYLAMITDNHGRLVVSAKANRHYDNRTTTDLTHSAVESPQFSAAILATATPQAAAKSGHCEKMQQNISHNYTKHQTTIFNCEQPQAMSAEETALRRPNQFCLLPDALLTMVWENILTKPLKERAEKLKKMSSLDQRQSGRQAIFRFALPLTNKGTEGIKSILTKIIGRPLDAFDYVEARGDFIVANDNQATTGNTTMYKKEA